MKIYSNFRSQVPEWQCVCNDGWEGSDCSQHTELQCDDSIDNDNG